MHLGKRPRFHYIVSPMIKAVRALRKNTPRKLPAFGSQVHFPVRWYRADLARPHSPAPGFQRQPPPLSLMLPLFAYSDIFLALAAILTHKSHLSNDIVKQASKCQHMALQSGDQRGEGGTPRWRLSSASSHLQVIGNQFPSQLGYLAGNTAQQKSEGQSHQNLLTL